MYHIVSDDELSNVKRAWNWNPESHFIIYVKDVTTF